MIRDMESPTPFPSYYSSLQEISKMEIRKKTIIPCRGV